MAFTITTTSTSFEIAVSGTASTAQALAAIATLGASKRVPQVSMRYKSANAGVGAYVKFGTSGSVAASDLPTSNALVAGNFFIADGESRVVNVPSSITHISAISEDHSGTGVLYLTVGYDVKKIQR